MQEDYISKIRKHLGHEPILIPHAVAIVFNEQNDVLIEVRQDDGFLDFPGGAIDIAEEVEDALKRELFEETGLIADEIELFKIYSGELTRYKYMNGDVIYGVDIFYIVKKYRGQLKAQENEVKELRFMKLEDIIRPVSLRNKEVINDLQQYVKRS